jgi:hypothetical protein
MGPAGRIDVVLVCGGRWHDFDYARLQLLAELGEHPHARTRVYERYDCLEALATADLLITYTCDVRPDAAHQLALVEFVARGGRWLALHASNSAIDAPLPGAERVFTTPRAFGPVARLLGSQFLGHPPIAPYTVEVTQPEHPLVEGVQPFTVTDELYVSELHPPLDVLLHAQYEGSCRSFAEGTTTDSDIRPVLYLRDTDRGTVCYFTLGHCRGRYDMQDQGIDDLGKVDIGSWAVPEYRTILSRCIVWGLGGAA